MMRNLAHPARYLQDHMGRRVTNRYLQRQFEIVLACRGTAFFFKQWGGARKHKAGRLLNGRTYDEMPLVSITPAKSESQTYAMR
ncbi:MAG: hypothetical protein WA634_04245 [Silvibacterium sp.]